MNRAAIITALPLEFEAVCAHLEDEREEEHPKGNVYTRGTFPAVGATWDVLVAEIGMGNPTAAQETERIIEYFDPEVILLVGVAGGIKDVSLGDVVAATKVYYYESGKIRDSDYGPTFQSRPEVFHSSFPMEQRAKAEVRSKDWLKRLGDLDPSQMPRSFVGPLATGEKIVASKLSDIYKLLGSEYSDALAVAMEDYGFLRAAFANPDVNALVIRGISDLIAGKSESDACGLQEIAARNASAFAFEVLAKLSCKGFTKGKTIDGGDRSIVIGREVIRSIIVTGDQNQFFIGNHERLRDAYVRPWSVFERVDLDHFVGREWLLDEIDAFLLNNDRGYFVLEAEAGLGKTTILAWLTQERGYIHHFNELSPGSEGIKRGLMNLAAQLMLAYDLSPHETEGFSPETAASPEYLYTLLKCASKKCRDGEKIVIVVDALDEAGTPEGQNVLGLPKVLPEGVYFIVTQRPVFVRLQIEPPRQLFHLVSDQDENFDDMRRFLEGAVTWAGIAQALEESDYTPEQFVETLMQKCHGVWIYLHFVIREIERGERSPLDLDALPDGLTQYYIDYWSRWREEDGSNWDDVYLPLLAFLAASQEAVTLECLISWTDIGSSPRTLRRLLKERWRPFLVITEDESEVRYRFYHATVQEFFEGQLNRDKLTSAQISFMDELIEETRNAHKCLVERYLTAWGGLDEDLPGLQDLKMLEMDKGYGLRHMANHMLKAERDPGDLLSLVVNPCWQSVRRQGDSGGSNLARDVELACKSAESSGVLTLPQYVAASLLKAKLRTQVSNLPAEAIVAYAKLGQFDQALNLAELMVENAVKTKAFWLLGKCCLDQGNVKNGRHLLKRTIDCLFTTEEPKNMVLHLSRLAILFFQAELQNEAKEAMNDAFELIKSQEDEYQKNKMLLSLSNDIYDYNVILPKTCLDEVENLARQIEKYTLHQAMILANIAKQFHQIDPEYASRLIQEAISTISSAPSSFSNWDESGRMFSQKNDFLTEAIIIAAEIGCEDEGMMKLLDLIEDSTYRANAYAELGRVYAEQDRKRDANCYLQKSLEILETKPEGMSQNGFRCRLTDLFLRVSELNRAKEMAKSIIESGRGERVNAFGYVAYYLAKDDKVNDALEWAEEMDVNWGRAFIMVRIAHALSESDPDGAIDKLREALQLARQIREGVVGSRNSAYVAIASGIGALVDVRPEKSKDLLDCMVADLQSQVGRHAIEVDGVRINQYIASVNLVEAITAPGYLDYVHGAEIAESIENDFRKNEALILCIQAACKKEDWERVDESLSEITDACWRLVGESTKKGWMAQNKDELSEIVRYVEENIPIKCEKFFPPQLPFGIIAFEFGISGHIAEAQVMSEKIKKPFPDLQEWFQLRLIQYLAQSGEIDVALGVANDIEYGTYKSKAFAYISRYYPTKDLSYSQKLLELAWKEINPNDETLDDLNRKGSYDDVLAILAGTVAIWDFPKANRIIQLIQKGDKQKDAKGEIISAISATKPDDAYNMLIEFVRDSANDGLAEFWKSLAACSEGLRNLIGIDNIIYLCDLFKDVEVGQPADNEELNLKTATKT